ncbi:MAG: HigA family addiction module antidote protein [Bacteroidetes bacterium]|nr:HigA family addiction module antidote protein [Bacteroidota bacterium]MBS1642072.1 HigA family addiction module antidote protein [Bacteroidota bacterium]MBS1671912.1 HigA family addiction module antidote protein [Bacteroidota bacterium]
MKTANEITPTHIFHPGLVLKEEIEYCNLTKKKVAEDMGISPTVLSEIISGKRSITTTIAIKIEKALGINALFFLNMQVRYEYYTMKKELKKHAA